MAMHEEDPRSRALTAATTYDARRSTVGGYSAYAAPDDHGDDASEPADDGHPILRRVERWIWASRVLAVASLLGLIAFIVALAIEPAIVRDYVVRYSALDNSASKLFRAWQNANAVGIPVYRKYYFYNVTNPYEVFTGVAPNIVEVGPFVYREVTQKYDIRWFLNGSVGYKYKRLMHFEPAMSIDELTGRPLDAKMATFTVPNPALKGILYRVGKLADSKVNKDWKLEIDACTYLDFLVNNTIVGPMGYFSQHTPDEFLWGYVDKLWDSVHWLLPAVGYDASTVFQCQWNGTAVVPSPYSYRAGMRCPLWQNQSACNGSSVGYTMETSGRTGDQITIPPSQRMQPRPGTWLPLNPGVEAPPGAPSPTPYVPYSQDTRQHGTITQWAGQRSQWLWGPVLDGLTGGEDPHPRDTWHASLRDSGLFGTAAAGATYDDEDLTSSHPNAAQCRTITGTDGTRFPPLQPGGGTLDVFVDMIGRSFSFSDTGRHTDSDIEANRYRFSDETLADSTANRYCYGGRFTGLFNLSRPAFGPGIASLSFFQRSCFRSDGALVPGSPNRARRCVDRLWEGDNGATDTDDGFTGPGLTVNLTFEVPPVWDPEAAAPLHVPRPPANDRISLDAYVTARAGGTDQATLDEFYGNYVDVNQLTGVVMRGRSDAMVSLALGPYTVDGCGRNASYWLMNFTDWKEFKVRINFFNASYNVPRTVIPFLRLVREATLGGESLDDVRNAFRLMRTVTALLWTGLSLSILGLLAAAAVRLVWVPRIAAGDPALYDLDSNLVSLGESQKKAALEDR
uniref:Uncharacterized protein n=1 Tax=Neobodo designis TaxID=312471 RepID=A0A7S1MGS8_NEODS|mmetsp:Transcript_40212/g.124255  ORF Transcript_40212/g.124255 Transcript_40212/m.124255 type:complete len:793 (+) Transcript_40212:79-2457(+)